MFHWQTPRPHLAWSAFPSPSDSGLSRSNIYSAAKDFGGRTTHSYIDGSKKVTLFQCRSFFFAKITQPTEI